MMNIYIVYGIINVLTGSFRGFLSKHLLENIDSLTYYSINNILHALIGLFVIFFGKVNFQSIMDLDMKSMSFLLLGPIISTFSILAYFSIISRYEISFVSPILGVAYNIAILIIGVSCFNETLTNNKIIGTLLASSAIYFLSQ